MEEKTKEKIRSILFVAVQIFCLCCLFFFMTNSVARMGEALGDMEKCAPFINFALSFGGILFVVITWIMFRNLLESNNDAFEGDLKCLFALGVISKDLDARITALEEKVDVSSDKKAKLKKKSKDEEKDAEKDTEAKYVDESHKKETK